MRTSFVIQVVAAIFVANFLVACGGDGEIFTPGQSIDPSTDDDPDAGPDSCREVLYYRDADGDGRGTPEDTVSTCEDAPEGYVAVAGDCDDACADCGSNGGEVCDGLDNDCDGVVDDGLARGSFYPDLDLDGYGSVAGTMSACAAPEGFVAIGGDCHDGDAAISPGAAESCNASDDDCDGSLDEGLTALRSSALRLGDAHDTFRNVAIAAFEGGYVVAWTTVGQRVVYQILSSELTPVLASPQPIDAPPSAGVLQGAPALKIATEGDASYAVLAWVQEDTVRARSIALADQSLSDVVTLSSEGAISTLPLTLVALPGEVVVVWHRRGTRDETHGRRFDPAAGAAIGDDVRLQTRERTEPDATGATAVSVAGATPFFMLGVVDRRASDSSNAAYVYKVQVEPELATVGAPARLLPIEGAAERVVLVAPDDADALQRSVLAFVTSASDATGATSMNALRPGSLGGAITVAAPTPAMNGSLFAGVASPSGADLVVGVPGSSAGRYGLSLNAYDNVAGSASGTPIADFVPTPWAAIDRRTDTQGAVIYTGEIGETSIHPGVWTRRYGCE